jgi:hypothetical protein
MENPSRTAERRSRPRVSFGDASSRPHTPSRRVVRAGVAGFQEAGRSIGRLVAGLPRWIDAASVALDIFFLPKRRRVLAPIAIDASSARLRRSRVIHRR